jgi:hypothetical protein
MLSKIICFLFAVVSVYIASNKRLYDRKMLYSDRGGYYLYLPSLFIYNDLQYLEKTKRVISQNGLDSFGTTYGLVNLPRERVVDKYPVGTAIFQLPLFLVAHAYCILSGAQEATGYGRPYNLAVIISTVLAAFGGLLFLRKFLRRYFSDNVTALVILCIGFGTNLYYYTTFEQGMSHPYSFFLFSAILYCTDSFYTIKAGRYIYYIAALASLAIITRPVNILLLIIPLCWNTADKSSLKERAKLLLKNRRRILIAGLIGLMITSVQLLYWKLSTGQWIFYSYQGEGFDWADPKIRDGLFSYRKGWFVYTPLALLAILGFFFTERRKVFPILLFFTLFVYVTFCWENWYYGGSYGCRPLIDALPLLAYPLARLCKYLISGLPIVRIFSLTIIFLFVGLNIFQSYQYAGNIIHWDRVTKAYYWRVFGKLCVSETDRQLLIPENEYRKEQKSWEND